MSTRRLVNEPQAGAATVGDPFLVPLDRLLGPQVENDLAHYKLMDDESLKQMWRKLDKNGDNEARCTASTPAAATT